jgi:hypothetical protein
VKHEEKKEEHLGGKSRKGGHSGFGRKEHGFGSKLGRKLHGKGSELEGPHNEGLHHK